jgi:hypothetical protein
MNRTVIQPPARYVARRRLAEPASDPGGYEHTMLKSLEDQT